MSFRRAVLLLDLLPEDSPLKAEIKGIEEHTWTPELRMSAAIFEAIQHLTWFIGLVNTDKFKNKKNPIPMPEPIPRPGVETKRQKAKKRGGVVFGGKNPSPKADLERFFGKPSQKRE